MNKNNEHLEVGIIGENEAVKYLENRGFSVVARNIRYKCGEIDVIVSRGGVMRFVEVKTMSVIRETLHLRPEHNITAWKIRKMCKAIEMYFLDKGQDDLCQWQIDIMAVLLVKDKDPIIEWYENVTF